MREEDIEIIYKNLHLDFVNKYFKNKKQQQKIHKLSNQKKIYEFYTIHYDFHVFFVVVFYF